MSFFDPDSPAGKLAQELMKEHYSKQSPTINIVNNNTNYDMGDNGIVQLGDGNTVTNPYKQEPKKWYKRIGVWLMGLAASTITAIVVMAIKHYMGW